MRIYNLGLDTLSAFQQDSSSFYWILLTGGSFDPDVDDVTDAIGGNEVSVAGYDRVQVTSALRTRNNSLDRMEYTCDDPDFGTLDTGETITACLLVRDQFLDDSTGIPVGRLEFAASRDTADFNPMTIRITDGLVAYTNEA